MADVHEVELEIVEMIHPGTSLDITKQMQMKFVELGEDEKSRIIGIELNYKSAFDMNAEIHWGDFRYVRALKEDYYGAHVYRYTQNLFINTHFLMTRIEDLPKLQVSATTNTFYLESVILTIAETEKFLVAPSVCHYRLDSIFGSDSPVTIQRSSFGSTKGIAEANACLKAENACKERRYSKKLETCVKVR